jgi:hypothetical protein
MTLGQVYGAIKKGRWFGRCNDETQRLCIMDGKVLRSFSIEGKVDIDVTTDIFFTVEDLLADDWVIYN